MPAGGAVAASGRAGAASTTSRSARRRPPADSKPVACVVGDARQGPSVEGQAEVDVGVELVGLDGLHRRVRVVEHGDDGPGVAAAAGADGAAERRRGRRLRRRRCADRTARGGWRGGGARARGRRRRWSTGPVVGRGGRGPVSDVAAADAVGGEPGVALEVARARARSSGPKMPSTRPASKPSAPSAALELGDVVASEHRAPVGRAGGRRAGSRPRPARSRWRRRRRRRRAARALPGRPAPRSRWRDRTRPGSADVSSRGGQPLLEVADGVAGGQVERDGVVQAVTGRRLRAGGPGEPQELAELLEELALALGADEALLGLRRP